MSGKVSAIMPKIARELSAAHVAKLVEPGFHPVGGCAGLALQIKPSGARSWVLRVMVGNKRREIGLGGHPTVGLAEAREKARSARREIEAGNDPVELRKAARRRLIEAQAIPTFAECARRLLANKRAGFKNAKHAAQWASTLETYASPVVGDLPVCEVQLSHVVRILEPIWQTKTETAKRVQGRIESVLDWAKVAGFRTGDNPARWRGHLDAILPKPGKLRAVKHHPALPFSDVAAFMRSLRERKGVAARALEFAVLTVPRSGEVRGARWSEFDLDARVWTVPADRMKAGKVHRVPLSFEALAILGALPRLGEHVFTAPRGSALSDMAISAVCRRMQVAAVPHGFRSSFKDWCRNSARFPDEVSELALAHVNSDATRAAYARDELMPQRRELMQQWAEFCAPSST